jgi:hypothetical protein
MKTTKSILVVLFMLAAAQIASAYYCPSTGRWLSRDPMGEPGFENLRAAGIMSPTVMPGSQSARWLNRDPIGGTVLANRTENVTKTQEKVHFPKGFAEVLAANPALAMRIQNQIAEIEKNSDTKIDSSVGNLYMFVQNDPASKVDALGLDIYYWQCWMACPCMPRAGVVTAWTLWPVSPVAANKACQNAKAYFCSANTGFGMWNYFALLEATETYYQALMITTR